MLHNTRSGQSEARDGQTMRGGGVWEREVDLVALLEHKNCDSLAAHDSHLGGQFRSTHLLLLARTRLATDCFDGIMFFVHSLDYLLPPLLPLGICIVTCLNSIPSSETASRRPFG
jgi:hypothetical protein